MDPITQLLMEFLSAGSSRTCVPLQSNSIPILVNLYETRDDVIIEMGLPGYSREDVEVTIHGRVLHVIANSKNSELFLESKVTVHNFAHVNLDKKFEIPEYLDTSNPKVSMNNGLLRIVMSRRNDVEKKLDIAESLVEPHNTLVESNGSNAEAFSPNQLFQYNLDKNYGDQSMRDADGA